MQESSFLRSALKYAEKDWHVFPLKSRDKTPLTKTGFKEATTDEAQIRLWAELYPDANIGISCEPSGLFVLDVDPRHNGLESLGKLLLEFPEIENAFTVKTGGGGFHFYFRLKEGQTFRSHGAGKKLGEGVDIRCSGGYVVAPTSIHPNGTRYTWSKESVGNGKSMPTLPEKLVVRLNASTAGGVGFLSSDSQTIVEGNRHNTLVSIAGTFRKMGMGPTEIIPALLSYNLLHCSPPLPDGEVSRIAMDIGSLVPNQTWDVGPRIEKRKSKLTSLNFTSFADIAPEELKFLWDGRILENQFNIISGNPGGGKSYATCALAAAFSTGAQLPDDQQTLITGHRKPISVLMCVYEDAHAVVRKRLERCGADLSRVHTIPYTSPLFNINEVPALESTLDSYPEVRVMFIDPVAAVMVGVDDHRDSEFRQAMQPLVTMAMNRKITVIAVKHLNKNSRGDISSRLGGTVAYSGLARSVLLVGHDNNKPPELEDGFRYPTIYGGIVQTKNNLGTAAPISYSINDNGFQWGSLDYTMTWERLVPEGKNNP